MTTEDPNSITTEDRETAIDILGSAIHPPLDPDSAAQRIAHHRLTATIEATKELRAQRDRLQAAYDAATQWHTDCLSAWSTDTEEHVDAIAALSRTIRDLITAIEIVDDEERDRAREESRSARVHTGTLRLARAALDDHGVDS